MSILHKECLATELATAGNTAAVVTVMGTASGQASVVSTMGTAAGQAATAATFLTCAGAAHVAGASIPTCAEITTGLATKADLVSGKVPAAQLPSYVDDVEEYATFAALPAAGETGKLYVTLDTEKVYRWTGTIYSEVSASATLSISDDGTLLTSTSTSVDFTGAGVTATNVGGAVTVAIPKPASWTWNALGDGSATLTFSDGTTMAIAAMPSPC